jgi:hypothetical protein
MRHLGYLFVAIIILAALLLGIFVGPSGLYYDDVACLYNGKFFSSQPLSILSFQVPAPLKDAPKFERICWIYYRPVERIAWTLVFLFLGVDTLLVGFLQKLLFWACLYFIYKIACLLLNRISGLIAVSLFILTPLAYGLLVWHAWLAAQIGLLFVLAGVYYTLKGFFSNLIPMVVAGIFLATLSGLSRESNVYIYFGVIFPYVIDYLVRQRKDKTKNLSMILVCASFVLCCLFYSYLFIKTPIYSTVGLELHKLALGNAPLNISFYKGEILASWNALFIGACLCLFLIFKSQLQLLGLTWALVGLIPLLFSKFIAKTYLFDSLVGFSLFWGAGLSLLWNKLCEKINDNTLSILRRFISRNFLKYAFIFIIAVLSFSFSAVKNLKEISAIAINARINLSSRVERVNFIKNAKKNSEIFVSRIRAQEFYKVLSKVLGRNDFTISIINSWSQVQELLAGDNLLKNSSFENNLEDWNRVEAKIKVPGLLKLTQDYSFDSGKQSLLIDTSVLRGVNYNLVDISQLVELEANQEYIFGGVVKLNDFKEGLRFEVAQRSGYQKGCWRTDIKSGNNNWQVLFNSFTPSVKQKEVFFYAARAENLIRGKAYIDGVFIYKTKKPILAYD